MINKMKKWLGIEGVKMELMLPEEIAEIDEVVKGQAVFQSMNPQTVTGISFVLIEKYVRGRGKDKLIDEYELGKLELQIEFEVPADELVEVDFELPFKVAHSEVETFGKKNFIYGGISRLAKLAHGAKSTYRVEAEATVKGVALSPFDKVEIIIK
ncbi:MAG: sporulation protein [Saprospiraceae bacterium]|nr:sporulation protein [Saprospiraceae bacterium]MCB9322651.1 sporulation protein [Lewinellaceae bacterium]